MGGGLYVLECIDIGKTRPQEYASNLDVVGDLPALTPLQFDPEVPNENLGRHNGLLAPDSRELLKSLRNIENVITRRPNIRSISLVQLAEATTCG